MDPAMPFRPDVTDTFGPSPTTTVRRSRRQAVEVEGAGHHALVGLR
jgi:hypothetical protein